VPPSRGRARSPSNTNNVAWVGPTSIPSSILIQPAIWPQQTWADKWEGLLCPLLGGGGSPSNTMSPGSRPTSLPSGILNPAVWPQQTWAKICGLCPFWGQLGPNLTQCGLGRGLPHTKWHLEFLIHPTGWPQYTITDRTGQTGQRSIVKHGIYVGLKVWGGG